MRVRVSISKCSHLIITMCLSLSNSRGGRGRCWPNGRKEQLRQHIKYQQLLSSDWRSPCSWAHYHSSSSCVTVDSCSPHKSNLFPRGGTTDLCFNAYFPLHQTSWALLWRVLPQLDVWGSLCRKMPEQILTLQRFPRENREDLSLPSIAFWSCCDYFSQHEIHLEKRLFYHSRVWKSEKYKISTRKKW